MLLGAALVIAALLLFCMNQREANQADADARQLLSGVVQQIDARSRQLAGSGGRKPDSAPSPSDGETPSDEETPALDAALIPGETPRPGATLVPGATLIPGATLVPGATLASTAAGGAGEGLYIDPYDTEMTVVHIDGNDYVGYVSIPELGVELPVMSQWSYPRLRKAPCRYSGSTKTDDLVILAHNYARHFGGLKELSPGDEVIFTDMNGIVSRYAVVEVDTVSAYSVDEVTSGEYDLTLFTCTYGGKSRVVAFCDGIG